MHTNPKRPPSVWISQLLLMLYALIMFTVIWAAVFSLFYRQAGPGSIFGFLLVLSFLSLLIAAFVGLAKRTRWGRWMAFVLLSLMCVLGLINQFVRVPGPIEYAEPRTSGEMSGYIAGGVVMFSLFVFLIYRLGFGRAASEFFNGTPDFDRSELAPPPPPTFDT
jgi:hypothetical protein